jgi:hypothetical protein
VVMLARCQHLQPGNRDPCGRGEGKMTARYADRDEVFEVGDAFYTPPGHVPVKNEPGTEILWFSPSAELCARPRRS